MQAMEDIFFEIAKSNKVEIDTVLRSAVNATQHSKQAMSEVHTDHEFEHNNFLLYLNDVTAGETILFSEDKLTELKIITPTKYKAVFFSSNPHAHKFCAYGERRLVFVVTFLGKIPPN
jgi:c-di-AMP phosphodiesterase-like protein